MFSKSILYLLNFFLLFCDSAFIDNIQKCSSEDSECLKKVIQSVIRDYAKTGIPEYSIPSLDPYFLRNNQTFHAANILDISLFNGVVKGISSCIVNKIEVSFESSMALFDVTCDVKVKGRYKTKGTSQLLQSALGGSSVHGDGKVKVVLDKVHLKFELTLNVIKKGDDFFIDYESNNYLYDIGKTTFVLSNLYLGETESSALIAEVMNNNWKMIIQIGGKQYLDLTKTILLEETKKFFDVVPAKDFLSDDLSQYVSE